MRDREPWCYHAVGILGIVPDRAFQNQKRQRDIQELDLGDSIQTEVVQDNLQVVDRDLKWDKKECGMDKESCLRVLKLGKGLNLVKDKGIDG